MRTKGRQPWRNVDLILPIARKSSRDHVLSKMIRAKITASDARLCSGYFKVGLSLWSLLSEGTTNIALFR